MKRVVVKIGGAAVDRPELLAACAQAVAALVAEGHMVTVVHGGGAQLTRTLKALGKTSQFVNGLRVSDAETRDVALMVLAGAVNKAVVAALAKQSVPSVGMSGGDGMAFRARKKTMDGQDYGFVGEIAASDTRVLESVWNAGAVPVLSSIALGYDGEYYNINADEMASACAAALHADALIFLTDVPGVRGEDGEIIRWLSLPTLPTLREREVITGGMLPKLHACEQALRGGVGRVRILPVEGVAALPGFYHTRIQIGTEVVA